METLLFPFEKVDKGSRIILYGFGEAGRQYFLQLKKTGYCEAVIVVDKEYEKMSNFFTKVYPPEKVLECPAEDYDYLVIAIDNLVVANLIKDKFVNVGIDDEKIIVACERRVGDWNYREMYPELTIEKIEREKGFLYEYLKTFFLFNRKTAWESYDYYPKLYNLFYDNHGDERILESMKKCLKDMVASPEKLIAFRLLYDLEIFDPECMKMFIHTLLEMEWFDDTPFIATMDASHMTHYGIAKKCIYPGFYNDRRELLKKICKYYDIKPGRKKDKTNEKKVAIVCFRLEDNQDDPAVSFVWQYAEEFTKKGFKIKLFICNTLLQADRNKSVISKKYVLPSMKQSEFNAKDYPFEAFFAEKEDVSERLREITDSVFDFNPNLILDMSDEFCPQMYILQQYFLTIYLPMRVRMSSSFFDYMVVRDSSDFREKNKLYKSVKNNQILDVKLCSLLPEDRRVVYSREAFGFEKDDFVIVSVGYRLNYELDEGLIAAMCVALKKNPKMKWVFVGDNVKSSDERFNELIGKKQIINHGIEGFIEAFYGICNAFLQPNRNGGGTSVRTAMRKGLPIILSDYPSDVRVYFKQEDLCVDEKEMAKEAEKLFMYPAYYAERSQYMKDIIDELTSPDDITKILNALKDKK